ncbi:hypothetical protein L2E82_04601 [Cichorium intybus]|uniref:Uncharacterized protein n=1 Tax=Cichorium intybus TaxID=13427 RepID=A0ACB9H5P7_CICIN|nr:hypothetical protein L2E82_04601 [Cichorium intybus]
MYQNKSKKRKRKKCQHYGFREKEENEGSASSPTLKILTKRVNAFRIKTFRLEKKLTNIESQNKRTESTKSSSNPVLKDLHSPSMKMRDADMEERPQNSLNDKKQEYLTLLEAYPVWSKAVTSALLTFVGDLICQVVIDQVPSSDLKRVSLFTFLGLALVGPTLHF